MKVWISKYALSKGIYEREVKQGEIYPDTVYINAWRESFHGGEGKEWHKTREDAVRRAEEMRIKKIASLKKQIEKLEKMKFE